MHLHCTWPGVTGLTAGGITQTEAKDTSVSAAAKKRVKALL